MIDVDVVSLARLQFAATALYHFLFVPLTLGLSVILGVMESIYFITKRPIWRDITKFWGVLFGINFAMGVATGLTMEFQFGTNWAYYSHYVGDIFGAPLAIEGLMAFFLEATFVGVFFFGWDRLSRGAHLFVTWMVALGSNLSALWILIANGWMQHPVGATFNFESMRMEVSSFYDVLFNPTAQAKFVHTISAGYVTGSLFVLGVSAFFLLARRNVDFAKRSMTVAAAFGLCASLSVVVLGDESGYTAAGNQKMKLAAIEGLWDTEPAPAGFNLVAIPDQQNHLNAFELKVPWLLGLIATRSTTETVPGINELVAKNEQNIRDGIKAYSALETLRRDPTNLEARATLEKNQAGLGYALLLTKYTKDVPAATDDMITKAAWDTVPDITPLFWTFRLMVALGFFFIALFAVAFWLVVQKRLESSRLFLRLVLFSIPLPWVSSELGWFVAEYGRQPWCIDGILPTRLGASSLTTGDMWLSLGGFLVLYSTLLIVELYLMIRTIRKGPEDYFGHRPALAPAPAK
jgi:cytochrome d ubiquinol oxidase subunit I